MSIAIEPDAGATPPASPHRHFLRHAIARPSAAISSIVIAAMAVACALASWVAPYDPLEQDLLAVNQGPSSAHWLGTDPIGRDVLSRLLHGGQVTLTGALTAMAVFATIGVTIGVIAGSSGGRVDGAVMKLNDLVQAMPGLIVLLVVLAIFGSSETAAMVSLGVLASPTLVRVVRASALEARAETYVVAARVAGLKARQVQWRHIIPSVAGPATTQITLFAAAAILTEAGLGFLGLGVQPPQPTWGNMVADATDVLYENPWMLVPTGAVLVAISLALGLLGNSIRDAYSGRSLRSENLEQTWKAMHIPVAAVSARDADVLSSEPDVLMSVRDLTVRVNSGRTVVVDRISFDVRAGEAVGIVGESGCGKTMAVTSLLRVTPPGSDVSASRLRLGHVDLLELDERGINDIRGTEIAYISQEPVSSLDPSFTAGQQVAEAVRHHQGVSRKDARRIAEDLFARVRLPHPARVAASYPHELSGGMAQRVAIARALAGEPQLLIADEPTTALDVTVQAEILDLLRELRDDAGMALVLVTHDFGVLADACDRALVMYGGKIVEDAPVDALIHNPRHPYSRALLNSNPVQVASGDRLPTIPGMVPAPEPWDFGCRFADRCPSVQPDCRTTVIPMSYGAAERRYLCLHPHVDRVGVNADEMVSS
jgi:peptide/nickel transport system permease protein